MNLRNVFDETGSKLVETKTFNIVKYRSRHGGYQSLNSMLAVNGTSTQLVVQGVAER